MKTTAPLYSVSSSAYDQRLGQFLSPDIMVQDPENAQNYNRYADCLNNPLKYTDPSGYESHFTINGETYWGMDTTWTGFSPEDIIRYGCEYIIPRKEKGFWKIMASGGDFGYDPDPGYSSLPDMVAVQISGNCFVGGGYGADVTLGYVKGEGYFINATGRAGTGVDVSVGFSFVTGDWTGVGKPTASSLRGPALYQSAGAFCLTISKTQDIDSKNGGHIGWNWNTTSYGAALGLKSISVGGSAGVSYTSPSPF